MCTTDPMKNPGVFPGNREGQTVSKYVKTPSRNIMLTLGTFLQIS